MAKLFYATIPERGVYVRVTGKAGDYLVRGVECGKAGKVESFATYETNDLGDACLTANSMHDAILREVRL